jgi:hypothetical protein
MRANGTISIETCGRYRDDPDGHGLEIITVPYGGK